MTDQIKRFKLLYYLMESLGEERMNDEMKILAYKIDEDKDERTETVLSYYEDKILMKIEEQMMETIL